MFSMFTQCSLNVLDVHSVFPEWQVYEARLHTGEVVAVKVQGPEAPLDPL
jgi:hypothetical protein